MVDVTALTREDAEMCPVRNVLSRVTGKWQVLILLVLRDEPRRFGALKRLIGDITQRVLTENLRSLERDGYLRRTVHTGSPVAVSYGLTKQGAEVSDRLLPLISWAAENHDGINKARAAYDASVAT